ncbi:histone-lysine n-methyltransferase set9 [Ophiostoma piceae UAMH 11346]|uniref:Histone-lysine N-methyltransferase SET9 n=1 Tax=Ophiostoma piceae (strain UAMH 11346) TaxID=1262450 RepID=S3C2C2_OPHP1|nr:histone-lysine n-methyltransferase set9 [Ophiostoma piceae UAMH 11346]
MAPARPRNAPPKKHILTLAQIASYDDILTDALVDHAFYWTTIPKNRPSYHPSRGVREEEITNIIQQHLVVEPDLQTAESSLLATNGLGKFYRALKTDAEKEDFRRHMRRYMQLYLPDCPIEVAATNRYTIFQEEASICARRFIKSNETIKYLSGIQVVITAEEEAELSERKKDFSIVVSSRKKEINLFMGPARFANHDCSANARLVTTGQAGIEIIATRSIGVGEEITVTYGESYFGEDNCECLCKTCEDNLVNGWKPAEGTVPVKRSVEDGSLTPSRGYSLRRREEHSFNRGNSETPPVLVRPKVSRANLRKLARANEATPSTDDFGNLSRGQKRDRDSLLATPPVTPAKRKKTLSEMLLRENTSRAGSESVDGDSVMADASPTPKRPLSEESSVPATANPTHDPINDQIPTPDSLEQLTESDVCESDDAGPVTLTTTTSTTIVVDGTVTDVKVEESSTTIALDMPSPEASSASEDEDKEGKQSGTPATGNTTENEPSIPAPTVEAPPPRGRGRPRKHPLPESQPAAAQAIPAKTLETKGELEAVGVEEHILAEPAVPAEPTSHRVPGDYTLTPLLLAEPETAWVVCSVCTKAFVQRDAYFTRMSCPRCERHSKLYGYVWPKTEPEGKWDKEERILDHRLVHRFLHAGAEAKIRGRKRGMSFDSTAATETLDEEQDAAHSRANMGSGIWRKLRYTIEKEKAQQAKPKPAVTVTTKTDSKPKAATAAKAKTAVTKTASKILKSVTPAKVVESVKTGRTTKAAAAASSAKPSGAARTTSRVVKTAKAFHGPRRTFSQRAKPPITVTAASD